MSRGSVSSWQTFARRTSEGMLHFTPGDDFENKRGGGWFVTYAKGGIIAAAFIVGIISAGFLGFYVGSSPKRKVYDPVDLVTDEAEDEDIAGRTSVIPHVRPTKYCLELTPVIAMDVPTKIKGRAVIEFHVDASVCLNELPLDAINVDTTSWKLSLKVSGQKEDKKRRRRRKDAEDRIKSNSGIGEIIENNPTMEGVDPTITSTDFENRGVTHEIDYLPDNTIRDDETIKSFEMDDDRTFDRNKSDIFEIENDGDRRNDEIEDESVEIDIKDYEIDAINGFHMVKLATCIGPRNYTLKIDYEVPVDGRAIYVANFTGQGRWLMGAKLKPVGVHRLLPVFDDIRFKSIFSISVSRPEEMRVLSNMPLLTSKTTLDNWAVDTFEETLLAPSNIAFAVGSFDPVEEIFINETQSADTKVSVKFWSGFERPVEEIYIRDKVDSILGNLIEAFQVPYPFPKLDVVALPLTIATDTSSPGLIMLKNSHFYADERQIVRRTELLKALIHLLGEQWLGGIINMDRRMDFWVLEGALIYLEHKLMTKIDSSLDTSHSFVADVQSKVMHMDSYTISRSLQVKVGHPYFDAWSIEDQDRKGACLIRMLHGAIGSTAFGNAYRKFITRWTNQSANLDAFLNTMEEEMEELLDGGGSLKAVMNSWITQGGFPVVIVTRNYEEGSAMIFQRKFIYDVKSTSSEEIWPIELTYINDQDDWSTTKKIWFKSKEEKLYNVSPPGRNSWILFNVNKTGYYRVHYDSKNWKLLSEALSKDHEIFTPETRASLVDDVLSLAAVNLLRYETAFDFIKYMQMKERHYAPWRVLMRHAFGLNNVLYMTPAFTDFQDFMVGFVTPLYREVGSNLEEGSQLTLTAIEMACFFDHFECLDWVKESFNKLRNDTASPDTVPGYIRETIYCTVARHGSREEWTYFLERAETVEDKEEKNRLLSSFACFQISWILEEILNEVLYGTMYSDDEKQVILRSFMKNPSAAQVAYRFVRGNWADIVERYSTSYTLMKAFIVATTNGLTNQQDLEDMLLFREEFYDSMKTVRYAAALVEAKANFTLLWLGHRLSYIREWLQESNKLNISTA